MYRFSCRVTAVPWLNWAAKRLPISDAKLLLVQPEPSLKVVKDRRKTVGCSISLYVPGGVANARPLRVLCCLTGALQGGTALKLRCQYLRAPSLPPEKVGLLRPSHNTRGANSQKSGVCGFSQSHQHGRRNGRRRL